MKPEPLFRTLCMVAQLPAPTTEHRFHPERRWRFDYAWPEQMIALEVEGGAWIGGRHTSGSGFTADLEKYSEAAALGWCVLRVQPRDLCKQTTVNLLRRAFEMRGMQKNRTLQQLHD